MSIRKLESCKYQLIATFSSLFRKFFLFHIFSENADSANGEPGYPRFG